MQKEMKVGLSVVLGFILGLLMGSVLLGIILGTCFGLVWGYSDHMLGQSPRKAVVKSKRVSSKKRSKSRRK